MPATVHFFDEFAAPALSKDGVRISLSARASYGLEKAGATYKIMDDYYSEKELRADEETLFNDQQRWMTNIDCFLQEQMGLPASTRFFSIHLNRIKYIVDEWIIRARILRRILNAEMPQSVVLFEADLRHKPSYSIYDFTDPNRYQWAVLLHQFQKISRPAPFELSIVKLGSRKSFSRPLAGFFTFLKKTGKMLARKSTPGSVTAPAESGGLRLLFLDEGAYAIDEPRRRFAEAGYEIWVKRGLVLENRTTGKMETLQVRKVPRERFAAAFREFLSREFLEWPSKYAGMDLEPILKPFFAHLFTQIFPLVLAEYEALLQFYGRSSISAVVSRATAGIQYPAALLAAENAGIPRVCFQHSIGPLDMPSWALDETVFTDLNFTMHPFANAYFKRFAGTFREGECQIESSSHYLRSITQKKAAVKNKVPKIFYVPTKLASGSNHFNMMYYTDTWYFEHQKKLCSCFGSDSRFEFIYKHSPQQRWAEGSILPWLKSRAFPNVRVESSPFSELVREADAVVFDYPSTGFFETAALGLPFFSLCHEAMIVNPDAAAFFGPSLQQFSNSNEALEKIKVFLDSPKKKFIHSLPFPAETDPVDVLDEFLRGHSHVKT